MPFPLLRSVTRLLAFAVLGPLTACAGTDGRVADLGVAPAAPPGASQASGPGAPASATQAGAASSSAPSSDSAPPPLDTRALTACATSGDLPFTGDDAVCLHFTPVDAGASASGENATDDDYAVRPSATPASSLVLFFIGTGGKPGGALKAGPKRNFFNAAVMEGRAVLAVSYANDASLGTLCKHDDACYLPTRKSILLGTQDPGSVLQVPADATYVARATAALRYLAAGDPNGGWGSFLAADGTLAWPKIVTAGHSQGGGHAAMMGKLFPVARVIQLSSTCDNDGGQESASWLDGADGSWMSDPTQFWGLGTQGDQTCPFHADSWAAEGMIASHQNDEGEVCGDTGDTHGESLKCADNFPYWRRMLR